MRGPEEGNEMMSKGKGRGRRSMARPYLYDQVSNGLCALPFSALNQLKEVRHTLVALT
jgi:hypothetical protein